MYMSLINRRIVVFSLLLCFFLQSFASLSTKSATFDEVQYFGIGKYLLTHHKWDVMGAILHPPLSYYISSIPLLFVDLDERYFTYGDEVVRDLKFLGAVDYFRGQGILSSEANKNDRLLIASRLMIAVLSLLLGYYIYRFSYELYGENSGILSLILFSFCPNILAFSGITVPDMPLTVFTFIAVYYYWLSIKNNCNRNILLAGLFMGLAFLSKFPAFLLLPIYLVIVIIYWLKTKKNLALHTAVIICIALFVFLAGYLFDLTPLFQGNDYRLSQLEYGQATFLNGKYSNHAWWYYFPLTFLYKTPLPLILLFLITIAVYIRNRRQVELEYIFLLLPIITVILSFSLSNYSGALRYLLPIYPFMFVMIGCLISDAAPIGSEAGSLFKLRSGCADTPAATWLFDSKNVSSILIAALLLWYIASSIFIAPDYLAYFNEIAGGPSRGYRHLVDANLDWGQDLKGLKKYMDKNRIERVSLSYFGADSPKRYGINYDWLPSHYLENPDPDKEVQIDTNQLLAISATNLQGLYLDDRNQYKWLMQIEPVAKIGYSIFVYDLRGQQIYINR